MTDLEKLRGFAQAMLQAWPEGGVDGGELQEIAVKWELLEIVTRTEPCGESCACAEVADFPIECYRRTSVLTGTEGA